MTTDQIYFYQCLTATNLGQLPALEEVERSNLRFLCPRLQGSDDCILSSTA